MTKTKQSWQISLHAFAEGLFIHFSSFMQNRCCVAVLSLKLFGWIPALRFKRRALRAPLLLSQGSFVEWHFAAVVAIARLCLARNRNWNWRLLWNRRLRRYRNCLLTAAVRIVVVGRRESEVAFASVTNRAIKIAAYREHWLKGISLSRSLTDWKCTCAPIVVD